MKAFADVNELREQFVNLLFVALRHCFKIVLLTSGNDIVMKIVGSPL